MHPPAQESIHPSCPFDLLHDSLLLHILSLVSDIKSLGRCAASCKRFCALVPLVDSVTVKVDCVVSGDDDGINIRGKAVLSHLCRLVVGSLAKPLQVLLHMLGPKKESLAALTHRSPREVLKNFKAIRSLRIELPGGELDVDQGLLLKWKAEFGSTLESCVILGASDLVKSEPAGLKKGGTKFEFGRSWFLQSPRYGDRTPSEPEAPSSEGSHGDLTFEVNGSNTSDPLCSNGELKLRVVWTISSLIAASARHYLLQQIISEHPTLQNLTLTDTDEQGMLCMGKEQLDDFRRKPLTASASANRTQVPALNMKLWYAPYLELGSFGLNGATLIAIKPSHRPLQEGLDAFISGAFKEPFRTAAEMLAKRHTYLLEMNSF